MPTPIYVEVEESDNSYAMPMQLFEARADPVPIENVRLFEPGRPHGVYEVTGWSSDDDGSPCPAMYVPVSDSGQAEAHLISRRRLGSAHEAVGQLRRLGYRQPGAVGRAIPMAVRQGRRHPLETLQSFFAFRLSFAQYLGGVLSHGTSCGIIQSASAPMTKQHSLHWLLLEPAPMRAHGGHFFAPRRARQ